WLCVSPKADTELAVRHGDELKLVFPQRGVDPTTYEALAFTNFFIQPMDGLTRQQNTKLAIEFCMRNPKWRLSLQTHKLLGIP
ncbi:hypothetical protein ACW4UO_32105, partial [Klebsiella pneumoniae]